MCKFNYKNSLISGTEWFDSECSKTHQVTFFFSPVSNYEKFLSSKFRLEIDEVRITLIVAVHHSHSPINISTPLWCKL